MNKMYFLLSLGLHGLVLILLLYNLNSSIGEKEPVPHPIEFEVEVIHAPSGGNGGAAPKKSAAGLSWKKIKPRLYIYEADGAGDKLTDGFLTTGYGYGKGDSRYEKYRRDYLWFYQKIDTLIEYPRPLAERNLGGNVEIQVEMNKRGCKYPYRHLKSDSRYFSSYIRRLFRHTICKEEFLKELLDEEHRIFDFRFTFVVVNRPNMGIDMNPPPPKEWQKLQGNFFSFLRHKSYNAYAWKLGPIQGVGLAPAVAIDPNWFVEKYEDLKDKKDKMRKFREDPDAGRPGY